MDGRKIIFACDYTNGEIWEMRKVVRVERWSSLVAPMVRRCGELANGDKYFSCAQYE
jgi:hypothetical protein